MFDSPNAAILASFLLVWVVGMVAMMFPAMIPVISVYARFGPGADRNTGVHSTVSSVVFLAGYLSLYALMGAGLFGLIYAIFQLGALIPWLAQFSLVGVAAVLFLAGVWQLSSLKAKSLTNCVSPMGFFLTHSKKGPVGALRMGAEHGAYCVGCCWLYMLVMLSIAAMSMLSMVLLSGLIIVEKAFVGGKHWFKWFSAGAFFLLAAIALFFPASLAIGL
jgi:predicted metal-binding membrane protein